MVALGGMHGCSQGGACVVAPGGMLGCSGGACMVALGRGHAWLLQGGVHGCFWGACMVAWGHAWLLWGACVVAPRGACMVAGGCAWDMTRYGDTINELVVRILLECILVFSDCYNFVIAKVSFFVFKANSDQTQYLVHIKAFNC